MLSPTRIPSVMRRFSCTVPFFLGRVATDTVAKKIDAHAFRTEVGAHFKPSPNVVDHEVKILEKVVGGVFCPITSTVSLC